MASFPLRNPIVLAAQWGRWIASQAADRAGGVHRRGPSAGTSRGRSTRNIRRWGRPGRAGGAAGGSIHVLRVLWTRDPASRGEFFRFDGIAVPAPPVRGHARRSDANNPHVFDAADGR
jgi:hypothetical protein